MNNITYQPGTLISTRFGRGIIVRTPYAKRGQGMAYTVKMIDGTHEGNSISLFESDHLEEAVFTPLVHGPELATGKECVAQKMAARYTYNLVDENDAVLDSEEMYPLIAESANERASSFGLHRYWVRVQS